MVDAEFILEIVLLGILHWLLAGMLLRDLANRKKVLGGKKPVWCLLIVAVAFAGSVLYLLCHPGVFFDDGSHS